MKYIYGSFPQLPQGYEKEPNKNFLELNLKPSSLILFISSYCLGIFQVDPLMSHKNVYHHVMTKFCKFHISFCKQMVGSTSVIVEALQSPNMHWSRQLGDFLRTLNNHVILWTAASTYSFLYLYQSFNTLLWNHFSLVLLFKTQKWLMGHKINCCILVNYYEECK